VDSALSGVDAVVCCLGVRLGQDPGSVRSDGTANLVAQMRRHGVRRLIAVSTVGAGSSVADQSRIARMFLPRIVGRARLIEADRAEAAIRAGGDELAWTLVRPPRLVDGAGGERLQVGPSVPTGMRSQLSRADLATVLLDQLTDERYVGAAVTAAAI
jgi:putative NADH-flavin reductase